MKVTVKSEIDLVSEVYRGHGIPEDILARWLSDVDGYIARQVLKLPEEKIPEDYSCSAAPDTELLVRDAPHRRIYFLYLSAMIDFTLKQFKTYANEIREYNSALDDYLHYVLCQKDNTRE